MKILITLLKPLSFLPALLMMYIIFSFSAQPGEVSGNLSYKISYEIIETKSELLSENLSSEEIAYKALPADLVDEVRVDVGGMKIGDIIRVKDLPIYADKKITIIAMTANAFSEDIQHSLEAGMNAHVSKPVDMKVLKKTIFDLKNK